MDKFEVIWDSICGKCKASKLIFALLQFLYLVEKAYYDTVAQTFFYLRVLVLSYLAFGFSKPARSMFSQLLLFFSENQTLFT